MVMTVAYLNELSADNRPFGVSLATQVANQLAAGKSIGYGHRDYCGMGLETNAAGDYLYGELWDGGLEKPVKFANKESFIKWLAQQSTASLARLDDADSFYRGNQVITRERLEAFVR